jgi:hypothetical protein
LRVGDECGDALYEAVGTHVGAECGEPALAMAEDPRILQAAAKFVF